MLKNSKQHRQPYFYKHLRRSILKSSIRYTAQQSQDSSVFQIPSSQLSRAAILFREPRRNVFHLTFNPVKVSSAILRSACVPKNHQTAPTPVLVQPTSQALAQSVHHANDVTTALISITKLSVWSNYRCLPREVGKNISWRERATTTFRSSRASGGWVSEVNAANRTVVRLFKPLTGLSQKVLRTEHCAPIHKRKRCERFTKPRLQLRTLQASQSSSRSARAITGMQSPSLSQARRRFLLFTVSSRFLHTMNGCVCGYAVVLNPFKSLVCDSPAKVFSDAFFEGFLDFL